MKNSIYPCLWFENQAKRAADFYCSIFKDSRILEENPMVVIFELNGSKFMGLNAGPEFKFNESISFVIPCDTQDEIDHYWEKLSGEGGMESRCGWVKDKFGISWQIVPRQLGEWMQGPEKSKRVMDALLKMNKLDMETLKNA